MQSGIDCSSSIPSATLVELIWYKLLALLDLIDLFFSTLKQGFRLIEFILEIFKLTVQKQEGDSSGGLRLRQV